MCELQILLVIVRIMMWVLAVKYKPLAVLATLRHLSHTTVSRSSFRTDSNVDTDEISSSNDPWSPTLLSDTVYIRTPNSLRSHPLPGYRLSYSPLYEAPGSKYVAMMKRLTLSFAVLGCYGAKLFYELAQFDDLYALATLVGCWTPTAVVQYKTKDYVTRIFRLYSKDKPQTLENLVNDEKLILEKLNATGGRTYNCLVNVDSSLQLDKPPKWLRPYSSWKDIEPTTGKTRHFYVADDMGGVKMDRLWGIVEHNSGVDNGRYIK